MPHERLLIVDDERDMLEGLRRVLSYELAEVEIETTPHALEALRRVRQTPVDLLLLDIRMPEMDGLELLEALKREDPWLTVVMMTGHGTIEMAVEAMKSGAYDFITKPFETEDLVRVLRKALERNRLIRENLNLRLRVPQAGGFQGFVGQSLPMRRLYAAMDSIARTDYTVLIRGESGTGKELAARAIHVLSKRGKRPLFTLNCPAIPEHLLESELFGHKRGAFTGADRDQAGLFEEADGGTLLLDEIGDIPVSLQTKLLRVLQEREVRPLGSAKSRKVDVRIIASTNRNLEEGIRDRSFREDLYYRLNVVSLTTPPLRDLREDIPLLVNHYTRLACSELGLSPKRFSAEALDDLVKRPWPGNVRELQNLIRRVVMFAPESQIRLPELMALDGGPENGQGQAGMLPPAALDGEVEQYKDAKERMLSQFTRSYVTELLESTGGNVTRAADISGLGRASFQKIMRRMGIRSEDYKPES